MSDDAKIVSKVLVLDGDAACIDSIKAFCDANDLVGLKVQPDHVMAVLRSNLDLGAILLSETYANSVQGGTALARKIHAVRPELPIFLRREVSDNLDDVPERDRLLFSAAYTVAGIDKLQTAITEFIFSRSYPNALVRGISEIAIPALESQFKSMQVDRYISFGSDNPQLCFKYTVSDPNDPAIRPLVLQQKFVFNLSWSPEDFSENVASVDDLVSSGELEFF